MWRSGKYSVAVPEIEEEVLRHLINDPSMLVDPIVCQSECMTAATDGSVLRVTQQGTVDIQVVALGVVNTVRLLNVGYAENLERNIL
ncbi:hypothetical protein PsorP6_008311 [Peronosclerospora sorghi]|uniref:Uncharacterized protein n=1 Tax=Peronosclerospora sorghi TaxID=230839 RepID=A0ACC0W907_9STRA|nr:hypothetical protein PsorP6_008311 [Peronosclerospora sorghi]